MMQGYKKKKASWMQDEFTDTTDGKWLQGHGSQPASSPLKPLAVQRHCYETVCQRKMDPCKQTHPQHGDPADKGMDHVQLLRQALADLRWSPSGTGQPTSHQSGRGIGGEGTSKVKL